MEYQDIINILGVITVSCMLCAMICIAAIGVITYKKDKEFEKSQIKYHNAIKITCIENCKGEHY